MARVNIPSNPDELIALAKGILAKHTADGASSPLSALNMADMTAKTGSADTQNQAATKLYRDAETATQNRDLALGTGNVTPGTVTAYVRSVRDILSGIHKGNEQKLGDWSFDVNASAKGSGGTTPPPAPKP